MPIGRNLTVWLLSVATLIALYVFLPERQPEPVDVGFDLPDNPPDIYVQGLQLTRYDEAGAVAMTTSADSLAVYNDSGDSHLQNPLITLHQDKQQRWRITANSAIIDSSDNIEFFQDVQTAQLGTDQPILINTDQMRVSDSGQRVLSDQTVTFTQGRQRLQGKGLDADLSANNAIINLLSDVSFFYDPS